MPLPESYPLATERLVFRRWQEEDFELACGLWGDPAVMELLGGPYDATRVQERLRQERESVERDGVQYWPIFLSSTLDHVGCCGLRRWTFGPDGGGLELGFHLRPAYWGRGLASEASTAAVRHGFEVLGVPCLLAGHHPRNDASRAVLARLGFQPQGEVFYPPTGLLHPTYRLLAEEFCD
jgi:ribosomal-protein-alanine N-acetyltransferase